MDPTRRRVGRKRWRKFPALPLVSSNKPAMCECIFCFWLSSAFSLFLSSASSLFLSPVSSSFSFSRLNPFSFTIDSRSGDSPFSGYNNHHEAEVHLLIDKDVDRGPQGTWTPSWLTAGSQAILLAHNVLLFNKFFFCLANHTSQKLTKVGN